MSVCRSIIYTLMGLALARLCPAQSETVCYEPCGCFSDEAPFDDRPLPQSPWEQEITWFMYSRDNPDEADTITLDVNGSAITIPPNFDSSRPSKFVIHGWKNRVDGVFRNIKDAFLGYGDFNVFMTDWQVGAAGEYTPCASNTRVVGVCSAVIATELHDGNLGNVHCIGHSMGGEACGYMGESTDGELGRISGLDPARPLFESNDTDLHLDPSDAQFVDVIHTNLERGQAFGLMQPVGHVDFYPNNGKSQPGCETGTCDHIMAVPYYVESIGGSCNFTAFPCQSEEDSNNCECETCDPDESCQVMGFEADLYPGRGTYFLRTVADAPYCEEPGAGPCATVHIAF